MVIINETVRVDLIVFLALFADLATIAVAYDNAHFEPRPVEWQLPKIWIISVMLGCLLAAGTWIMRGTMFLEHGGVIEDFGNIQEILFLQISLTQNWLIFVTRGGKTWPSPQLVLAILGVDIIATIMCIFGGLVGNPLADLSHFQDPSHLSGNGRTDVVTVVVVWGYSVCVTTVIAIVYYLLNQLSWLDNLGRARRSRTDTQMENVVAHLSKLAFELEREDEDGRVDVVGRMTIKQKAEEAEEDD
jgi:H+-transporting ATPase